ncbi:MAG: amidohydrolase [Alphaproteobacteria bacterium]|nr:MAG: amidohydrolase [Alphaproteobacteria bacterium]
MRPLIAAIALCLAIPATTTASAEVDKQPSAGGLLIYGGPIYTADDHRPQVEAVVIRGKRIVFVGNRKEAEKRARGIPGLVRLDLKGAAAYPGFTDSHAHLFGIGLREMTLNLEGTASLAEMLERIRRAAARGGHATLYGRGWIETHWPEGRFPTRGDLDPVTGNRPALFVRADGHALVANSAALAAAGITAKTPDPPGGAILRDEHGRPTGMLIDRAMDLVADLMPGEEDFDRRSVYRRADAVTTALGWTGVHNMSVAPRDVPLLEKMAEDGELRIRVYNAVTPEGAEALFAHGPRQAADGRVITRAVKLYMDGALGSRGAALLAPYSDAPKSTGLLQMTEEEALGYFRKGLTSGIQIATHAIGDRANRLLLDWIAKAMAMVPRSQWARPDPRFRDEHAQILNPADIPRFAKLGVIASMQPSHAISDLFFAPKRLGLARLKGAYAWRSLISSGAVIAAGSDAPVERGDPRIEFYAAVYRHSIDGYQGEGWHPEEAVDRGTALKMFTLWPAYASFREDELGTITVGKRADLTVFSGDIMTLPPPAILKVKPLLTIIDGRIVHDARTASPAED